MVYVESGARSCSWVKGASEGNHQQIPTSTGSKNSLTNMRHDVNSDKMNKRIHFGLQ